MTNHTAISGVNTLGKISQRSKKIRDLNDKFRTAMDEDNVYLSLPVAKLGGQVILKMITNIASMKVPTKVDDPEFENDHHKFTIDGRSLSWQIYYYDNQQEDVSVDPSDEKQTIRLMTISMS